MRPKARKCADRVCIRQLEYDLQSIIQNSMPFQRRATMRGPDSWLLACLVLGMSLNADGKNIFVYLVETYGGW
jgi:hypothetical protein